MLKIIVNTIGFLKSNMLTVGAGLLVGLSAGLYVGAAVSKGYYEGVLRESAEQHGVALQESIDERDRLSKRLAAEQEASARQTEQRAEMRQEADEVNREIASDPDSRDCEWRDPHRLRIERIYDAYGLPHSGAGAAP